MAPIEVQRNNLFSQEDIRFGPNGVMAGAPILSSLQYALEAGSTEFQEDGDCCLMKRIRISKTALYLVFVPSAIGIHTWAWWYFGPYSFGAFAVTIAAYMLIRILIAKLLPFVR